MTDVSVAVVPAVRITRGFDTDLFIRRMKSSIGLTCQRSPTISSPTNSTTPTTSVPTIIAANRIPTTTKLIGDARRGLSMLSP
jgi:hypothetical protein